MRFADARGRICAGAPLLACALAALCALVFSPPDLIVHNRSASMPQGFYWRAKRAPAVGEIVSVRARDVAGEYASLRGFDDYGDRFLKRIAAGDGDEVCARGAEVRVNGAWVARRLHHDELGRALPTWKGCVRLHGQYLLLGDGPSSFDGRYWGPVEAARIEAVWRPF